MLSCFLLYNNVNESYVYIYPSFLSFPITPPMPPLQVITEHRAELPVSHSSFPLASCFTHGKESTCDAGDAGSNPGSGRCSEGLNGNPLQYSCLGNPLDRGAWLSAGHGVAKESEMIQQLNDNNNNNAHNWGLFIISFQIIGFLLFLNQLY